MFPVRAEAVRMLNFPSAIEDIERARRRLALDEFIELQLQLRSRRKNFEARTNALPCGGDNRLMKRRIDRSIANSFIEGIALADGASTVDPRRHAPPEDRSLVVL